MGFFKKIKKAITHAPKAVVKTVVSPKKLTTAIITGGASVVAPKVFKPLTEAVGSTLYNPSLVSKVVGVAAGAGPLALAAPPTGAPNMGLNLTGLLTGAVSGLATLAGGGSPSQALGNFQNFLPSMGTGGPFGAPTTSPGYGVYPTMAAVPAAARAVATVGRSFFARFPNLATAIQGYRNMGKNVTRAKLYSLLKRFGPEFLITGGILTAAAVNELLIAGPGRRRMNPGNVKALRRSLRRLESFHGLCMRVDKLRRPRSRKTTRSSGTTQFVRQG